MTGAADELPRVRWGDHSITRLLLGHNMLKGTSHRTKSLSEQMRDWHAPELGHDIEMLRRVQECGINTVHFGGRQMQSLISRHRAEGGALQWIATVYDPNEDDAELEEELRVILAVDPKPLGVVYFGERTDRQFLAGRTAFTRERARRLRDTGVLVGICSHLPQAIDRVESEGWDVDFYMTCFYTVYTHADEARVDRGEERYDDKDRGRMVEFIKQASRPCIAFKILAAGRKCGTDEEREAAFRFAYENIKPTDIVAVGMWQKYKDQVAENAQLVRDILRSADT